MPVSPWASRWRRSTATCCCRWRFELYFQYKQIIEKTNQVLEITIVVTAIYFILAFSVNRIMAFIENRVRVPGYITTGGK